MTKRIAFKMQLNQGSEAEYRRRHDAIWPELKELLKGAGVSDYSIYLDARNGELTGVLKVSDDRAFADLSNQPVMKKWWTYMEDIMVSNPDHSPVSFELSEVFYLE